MTNKTILEAPRTRAEICAYINRTPILKSLLYDLDLLPEQHDENTADEALMRSVVGHIHSMAKQAAAEQPTKSVDERAAFEAWMEGGYSPINLAHRPDGSYLVGVVANMYAAWQARSRQPDQAAEQPEKEGGRQEVTDRMYADLLKDYLNAKMRIEELSAHHPDSGEWVSVPREPTEAMIVAGMEASVLGRPSVDDEHYVKTIYHSMLCELPPVPKD